MKTRFLTFILLLITASNINAQCNCEQNIVLDLDGDMDDISVPNFITTQNFTISVWFRHPDATGGQEDRIFGTSTPRLELGLNNDGELWVFDGSVKSWPGNLNECTWHHAVLTKQSGNMSIYLDGVFVDSWSVTPTQTYGSASGSGMKIGNWFTTTISSGWKGQLDDFVVLDYAAPAFEINDLRNCNYNSLIGNVVAHWDWNNGNPNGNNSNNAVVVDLTGNYTATFNDFALIRDDSNYVVCETDCLPPTCPPDYINGSNGSLTGTVFGTQVYETDGAIESTQTIGQMSNVEYNSNLCILLEAGFSTEAQAEFTAIIDGCPD